MPPHNELIGYYSRIFCCCCLFFFLLLLVASNFLVSMYVCLVVYGVEYVYVRIMLLHLSHSEQEAHSNFVFCRNTIQKRVAIFCRFALTLTNLGYVRFSFEISKILTGIRCLTAQIEIEFERIFFSFGCITKECKVPQLEGYCYRVRDSR